MMKKVKRHFNCSICEKYWCVECAEALSKNYENKDGLFKCKEGHSVEPELEQENVEGIVCVECDKSLGDKFKFICKTCNEFICYECAFNRALE